MESHTRVWSLVLLAFTSLAPVYAAGTQPSTVNHRQLVEAYGKLPLSFELNQGQADGQVKFLSRGSGYGFYLTARGAILALQSGKSQGGGQANTAILRMGLIGANASAVISGVGRLPGTSNYFVGNNAERWRTNVPTYAQVKYGRVYPGVDLVYHGNQRQLEYDFVLAAGARPEHIQLSFDGAKTVSIAQSGDLRISVGGRDVLMHAPVAYQELDGGRKLIAASYALRSRTRLGFRLGVYDRSKPLVIDPVLVYSTYLGGGYPDGISGGIAIDASGNAYITGGTSSLDFPVTPGAFRTTFNGSGCGVTGCSADAFISKLNADGSALVYSTYLGGSDFSTGNRVSIAVDTSGNAYVTGSTNSSDFPTTPGAFQSTYRSKPSSNGFCNDLICSNAFVSKLNATGSALVYSTYLGGTLVDVGMGIAVDTSGNAYVTGNTMSSDFPTTPGALQTTIGGGPFGDAFVSKLNAAGSRLVYSTYLGGGDTDSGWGIAVDTWGNAYVTGNTVSSDFPTTPGALQTTIGAVDADAFVSKLNAAGSALVYSTYLGGSGGDGGTGITIDTSGNAYITGATSSPDFPTTPGAFQTSYGGVENAFVSKLNAAGSALVYSTYLGGSSADIGYGITIDTSGNAYVTGFTTSLNFPTTSGAFQPACESSGFPYECADAFVTRLSATGSALVYSTYLGGNADEEGLGIAVDGSGNAYVAGWTRSSNFPVTPNALQPTFGGFIDAFITKFSFGIPFSSFNAKLRLDVDDGAFDLKARFTLGAGASINPLTERVMLGIGPYSVAIPAGSFKRHGEGYRFDGAIGGVHLELSISRSCQENGDDRDFNEPGDPNLHGCAGKSALRYTLRAQGRGANLSGIANPVAITVAVGNNTGSTRITADFD